MRTNNLPCSVLAGLLILGVVAPPWLARAQSPPHGYGFAQPRGLVPTPEVAVRIAEAILEPIYGRAKIRSEHPFTASLSKGVWSVAGTLGGGPDVTGGVAMVRLLQKDARIVYVSHGK